MYVTSETKGPHMEKLVETGGLSPTPNIDGLN